MREGLQVTVEFAGMHARISTINLENAGRKLKPYVDLVARMCSTIDSGENGYKLFEQILFNFLVLFPTQR